MVVRSPEPRQNGNYIGVGTLAALPVSTSASATGGSDITLGPDSEKVATLLRLALRSAILFTAESADLCLELYCLLALRCPDQKQRIAQRSQHEPQE